MTAPTPFKRRDSNQSANSFYDENLKTFIECNNPSDALLATLALKDGVDIDLVNAFLSIVRNPAFDSKEVTFKNTGEVLVHVARQREDATGSIVHSKATHHRDGDGHGNTQVPQIVVDLAIIALRDEMLSIAHLPFIPEGGSWDDTQNTWSSYPQKTMLSSLLNCALVHSSWLLPTRRAAGFLLQKLDRPILQFIRNPCFGQWTNWLYLRFNLSLPCSDHVAALFQRTPNITFLAFDFSRRVSNLLNETVAQDFSIQISRHLRQLNQLSLSMQTPDPRTLRTALSHFVTLPNTMPHLKTLCFSGIGFGFSSNSFRPPFWPDAQRALQTLTHVHVRGAHWTSIQNTGCISLSWARSVNVDAEGLRPVRLRYGISPKTNEDTFSNLSKEQLADLSVIRSLRLDYYDGGDQKLNFSAFLQACSSITTLDFRITLLRADRQTFSAIGALSSCPPRVEEILLHIQLQNDNSQYLPPSCVDDSDIDRLDVVLRDVLLSLDLSNKHRAFRSLVVQVHADIHMLRGGDWISESVLWTDLPCTKSWCIANRIRFNEVAFGL